MGGATNTRPSEAATRSENFQRRNRGVLGSRSPGELMEGGLGGMDHGSSLHMFQS